MLISPFVFLQAFHIRLNSHAVVLFDHSILQFCERPCDVLPLASCESICAGMGTQMLPARNEKRKEHNTHIIRQVQIFPESLTIPW